MEEATVDVVEASSEGFAHWACKGHNLKSRSPSYQAFTRNVKHPHLLQPFLLIQQASRQLSLECFIQFPWAIGDMWRHDNRAAQIYDNLDDSLKLPS